MGKAGRLGDLPEAADPALDRIQDRDGTVQRSDRRSRRGRVVSHVHIMD
jgi:hypothetical protein